MMLSQILLLAIIQGLCELLPVSSSAHVIVAERLMGLDPTTPEMTLLLVALHTGTMFAVIVYFRRQWRQTYLRSRSAFLANAAPLVLATAATAVVGLALLRLLPALLGRPSDGFEVEQLFGDARLMAGALAAAGLLILVAGLRARGADGSRSLDGRSALAIGAVQGLCLPFRGFSRSGATISTGLLLGVGRQAAEEFSFALAVILTPPVVVRELHRLFKAQGAGLDASSLAHLVWPSLAGMMLSFAAGLVALRWLSRWLEHGRWHYFGIYCLVASLIVILLPR